MAAEKKKQKKSKAKRVVKLGSGMAERTRKKIKNRGQQIDAILNEMD